MRPPAKAPSKLDGNLRAYATDRQWEYMEAWVKFRSKKAAAKALGVSLFACQGAIASVYAKAARQGYAPDYDLVHPVPEGLTLSGTSIRYDGDGNVEQFWNKTKPEGADPDAVVKLPDPKVVTKTATLFDSAGRVTQQWVSEKPEALAQLRAWEEAAKAMAESLPVLPLIDEPTVVENSDLMACYPIGDHHLGMLSWNQETGADWDLALAEKALAHAADYLLQATPACPVATVVFLGDFLHYDSFDAVTPTSRNLLDADGRYPKMVRASIRSMRNVIESAARRHGRVHVIVEIGNHDLSSSIFLMECLSNIYADNPRITVDTSPMHFHYFEHGACLVGTHHGHGAKADRLPSIMAADRPQEWGRTKFRYWWTGHIHHATLKDFEACSVESFRILAPADAWAHQKGFRATRDMKAIMLHREFGEVSRHTVNPGMYR